LPITAERQQPVEPTTSEQWDGTTATTLHASPTVAQMVTPSENYTRPL